MNKIYVHHVGEPGGNRDFPKTIFSKIEISYVASAIEEEYRDSLIPELTSEFPSGKVNIWGVPEKANSVIRNLKHGDYVFLIGALPELASGIFDGEIVALCEVKVFPKITLPKLSHALWGEAKFPYIFFFETEVLKNLTWQTIVSDLEYEKNYTIRGHIISIANTRLSKFQDADHYISLLREKFIKDRVDILMLSEQEIIANIETDEDKSVSSEDFIKARLTLRSILKETPELTDEERRELQLISKPARSLAFKSDVRFIYQNRCSICGRGLISPSGNPEVQSAHIYPRGKGGSDDPRNGVALCSIHHWALDSGWISFNDLHEVLVREDIPEDDDYKIISDYAGKKLRLPNDKNFAPAIIYLSAHRQLHGFE